MKITPQNIATAGDTELLKAANMLLEQAKIGREKNPLIGRNLPAKLSRFKKNPTAENACAALWDCFKAQAYLGQNMGVETSVRT